MLFIRGREVPEPEDLRCEYAAAEVHVGTLTSGVWQSAAIVVGGSMAAFAFLIDATFTYSMAAVVTVLALGAVLVIEMWRHNWRRHKRSIDNRWVRMREIERERGMRTNIYLYLLTEGRHEMTRLDEWRWLSVAEQGRLRETYDDFPEPPCRFVPRTGQEVLGATACLAQVGWLLMIALAWTRAVGC
jgi:hypothetical protein